MLCAYLADVNLVAAGAADLDVDVAVAGDVLADVDLRHHGVRHLQRHRRVHRVLETEQRRLG